MLIEGWLRALLSVVLTREPMEWPLYGLLLIVTKDKKNLEGLLSVFMCSVQEETCINSISAHWAELSQ